MKWDIEGVVINKKLFPCGASTEVEKSATSSGADNIATFTTNERKPLTSLDITIVPSQEGSGDPSPDNVRPLISYDKVTAKIQKGTTKVKEVVSFGKTVYAVTGDAVTGEFEETWGAITLDGTQEPQIVNWRATDNSVGWIYPYSLTENAFVGATVKPNVLSDKLTTEKYTDLFYGNVDTGVSVFTSTDYGIVVKVADTSLTTKQAISDYLSQNPITVVYKLATPTELTTDPVTITTFSGEQTVRFDEKIPFTLKYLTLEGSSCDTAKQFLPLFYNKERRSL